MRPSTKRILSIGAAFLLLIGALIVYQSFIQPEGEIISTKRGLVNAKTDLFERQQEAVAQVQNLISQFQNVRTIQEAVSLAMPDSQETTRALSQIEAIGRSSAVIITAINFRDLGGAPSGQILVKKLGKLEFDINTTGSYQGLKSFLRSLETNIRVANVKKLSFEPVGSNAYNLNLVAEIYYQQD